MKNNVFLFVAFVLIGVGVLVYYQLGSAGMSIVVNGVRDNSGETRAILQYSIGGGLAGLGLIFLIVGLRGRGQAKTQQKEIQHIMQTGIPVDGTVTFADKNYSILVNKKPVYSIVEYTYQDGSGKQHTRRIDTIPSDYVIRNKIQVGGKVAVKYAVEDPAKSTLLL